MGNADNLYMGFQGRLQLSSAFPLSRWVFLAGVAVLFLARVAYAEDASFFDHNYAATGIVRPGNSRIAPEVKAPESPADQMLQTEAKVEPRDKIPRSSAKLKRQKSYQGRFVNRQGGTEARTVPYQLGEVGSDLP